MAQSDPAGNRDGLRRGLGVKDTMSTRYDAIIGFFSRLREVNRESSFSVLG